MSLVLISSTYISIDYYMRENNGIIIIQFGQIVARLRMRDDNNNNT